MTFIAVRCPHCQSDQIVGSVSNAETVAPMALTYKVLFSTISTFETLPIFLTTPRSATALGLHCDQGGQCLPS
jgi:hypothetical protein